MRFLVSSLFRRGTIQENEDLLIGPFESGEFIPVRIQTVHRHRVPCRIVRAGQTAAISLGRFKSDLNEKLRKVKKENLVFDWYFREYQYSIWITNRKGMVLVSEKEGPKACSEFEADVYLFFHANQITQGFQVTVHIGNVCQTASIVAMNKVTVHFFLNLIFGIPLIDSIPLRLQSRQMNEEE
jgi:GTPase